MGYEKVGEMTRVFRVVTILLAVVVLSSSYTMSVLAAPSGGIGGRPAKPDPANPRTQSIFIHTLDKGESAEDAILLVNSSDRERAIELYAVDGVVSSGGAYSCRQKSEPIVGSGKWINLAKSEIVLAANSEEEVDFKVTVPDKADVGEHNACLVIADKDNDTVSEGGGIRIRTRQAVRVATTIPGDLHREVTLSSFTAKTGAKRGALFNIELQNKGNVSADVNVGVRLISKLNDKEAYKEGGVYPILANEKLDLNFEQEKAPFWGGWYKARLKIEYNSSAALLGFNPNAGLAGEIISEQELFIMPSTEALVIMAASLLLLVLTVVLLLAKRSRMRSRRRKWKEYSVISGDSLESLSSGSKVKWKLLAKTNMMSAPYTLREGQVIVLPEEVARRANARKAKRQQEAEAAAVVSDTHKVQVKRPGWSGPDKQKP